MSDLPDLNTDSIGYIAYWNALENGNVGEFDPSEVVNSDNVNSYQAFDNGVHITSYTSVTGREISCRAKTDGWIIAYMDRTNDFAVTTSQDNVRGYIDIVNDWTSYQSFGGPGNHTLERAIYDLASQASNFGSMTYNASDVSLFNYEYPNATGTTILHESIGWSENGDKTMYHTNTSNVLFGVTGGTSDDQSGNGGGNGETIYEGQTLSTRANYGTRSHGQAGTTDTGVQYQTTGIGNDDGRLNGAGRFSASIVVMWE